MTGLRNPIPNLLAVVLVHFSTSVLNAIIALDAQATPMLLLLLGRMLIPGVIALVYTLYRPSTITHISPIYFLHGCLCYAGTMCTYYGCACLPMQLVTIIGFTKSFFTIALSHLVTHERPSKREFLWLVVACGCACSTILSYDAADVTSYNFAVFMLICANLLVAVITILSKHLTSRDGATQSTAAISITTALTACVYAYFTDIDVTIDTQYTTLTLVSLGIMGTVYTILTQYSLTGVSASFLLSFQYIRVPFSILFDYYLLGRPINPWTIPGAIGIIIATTKFTQHYQARSDKE